MHAAEWAAWFSGIGASAAVVGLGITWRNRQDQSAERREREKDQARLITSVGFGNGGGLSVRVTNGSTSPISRLSIVHASVGDDFEAPWRLIQTIFHNSNERQLEGGKATEFAVEFLDEQGKRKSFAAGHAQWTIEFRDAAGRAWRRTTDREPVRINELAA